MGGLAILAWKLTVFADYSGRFGLEVECISVDMRHYSQWGVGGMNIQTVTAEKHAVVQFFQDFPSLFLTPEFAEHPGLKREVKQKRK
jgi:hypothetical protein